MRGIPFVAFLAEESVAWLPSVYDISIVAKKVWPAWADNWPPVERIRISNLSHKLPKTQVS